MAENNLHKILFSFLKIIDEYKFGMKDVNAAYQLQVFYQPDRSLWNLRRWWGFFLWGIWGKFTNVYLFYIKICNQSVKNWNYYHMKRGDTPKTPNHYEFVPQIAGLFGWRCLTCRNSVTKGFIGIFGYLQYPQWGEEPEY